MATLEQMADFERAFNENRILSLDQAEEQLDWLLERDRNDQAAEVINWLHSLWVGHFGYLHHPIGPYCRVTPEGVECGGLLTEAEVDSTPDDLPPRLGDAS